MEVQQSTESKSTTDKIATAWYRQKFLYAGLAICAFVLFIGIFSLTAASYQVPGTQDRKALATPLTVIQDGDTVRVANIPEAGEEQDWQLWSLDKNNKPTSLGVLNNEAEYELLDNTKMIAITKEPKGGSQSPTTQPVWNSIKLQA